MATEEDDPRTHSLPPYPQMILAAISFSSDDRGATLSEISAHIASCCPGGDPALLTEHLARMTAAGELHLIGECYFRAGAGSDALTPGKRGRGRPPKPRIPGRDPSDPPASKRRGRPPKPVVPDAPVKVPRPRGRPPKNAPSSNGAAAAADGPGPACLAKRPRGRPPKVRQQFTEVGFL